MKVYTRNNKPNPDPEDPSFSVDVIIMTEDDLLHIGYYDFEDDKWEFHTDTLFDMEEIDIIEGKPCQFKWMYAPEELFNL